MMQASSKNLYAYHILGKRIWKNNDRIRRKISTNTTSWRCILQNRCDTNVQRFVLLQINKQFYGYRFVNKFEDTLVNSRNKKYIFRNLGRGYHAVREDPIVDHIPRETLTRTELKYVIMIRNKKNLPLPNEILRSKSGSGVHT